MKALDFVRTPKGNMAIVTETRSKGSGTSIEFIGEQNPEDQEKTAWWDKEELIVIDSLPRLLALTMSHNMGMGWVDAERFFGIEKPEEPEEAITASEIEKNKE